MKRLLHIPVAGAMWQTKILECQRCLCFRFQSKGEGSRNGMEMQMHMYLSSKLHNLAVVSFANNNINWNKGMHK